MWRLLAGLYINKPVVFLIPCLSSGMNELCV